MHVFLILFFLSKKGLLMCIRLLFERYTPKMDTAFWQIDGLKFEF